MQFIKSTSALVALALAQSVNAYTNNCQGSGVGLNDGDCTTGLNSIDTGATYSDQAQFSVGDCYIIYATNGAGAQPVSGQTILNTANTIISACGDQGGEGSYGTNNCESCHVTINYRSPK